MVKIIIEIFCVDKRMAASIPDENNQTKYQCKFQFLKNVCSSISLIIDVSIK